VAPDNDQPRLKGCCVPTFSLRDVEDLLAERGIMVSYQTIRTWIRKLVTQIAKHVGAARRQPSDSSHQDEVLIMIHGVKHWLWYAVDSQREAIDFLVQSRALLHKSLEGIHLVNPA
jgi:putative transposase